MIIHPERPRPPPVTHGRTVPGWTAATVTGTLEPVTSQQRRPVTTRTSPAAPVSREPRAARPTNYPGRSGNVADPSQVGM